ncbi:MAG: biotin--[acetyl-CoA-carboxylase] ligase [Chloroflexi bacterium]|nr:biotin--[acetyl-CoA-carboxylase] ligase [Chloroflexota bacterium]
MRNGTEVTLSQELLEQRLTRPFKYFDRVESSNDEAAAWLAAGAPEGAGVIANEQTRGRGRGGRHWHTPPNVALALSLILKPNSAYLPRLNMLAALSVYDLARECGCEVVGIKWPNDVQVNGLKVSGVLPEAIWEAGELRGAILGIGVNVRMDFNGTELQESAISLEDVVKKRLDRGELIANLLRRINHWYCRIASPTLFSTWKSRLNTLGQSVTVNGVKGVALDVNTVGALLIRDDKGQTHRIDAGDLIIKSANESR